jgi:hypothetical protein
MMGGSQCQNMSPPNFKFSMPAMLVYTNNTTYLENRLTSRYSSRRIDLGIALGPFIPQTACPCRSLRPNSKQKLSSLGIESNIDISSRYSVD